MRYYCQAVIPFFLGLALASSAYAASWQPDARQCADQLYASGKCGAVNCNAQWVEVSACVAQHALNDVTEALFSRCVVNVHKQTAAQVLGYDRVSAVVSCLITSGASLKGIQ